MDTLRLCIIQMEIDEQRNSRNMENAYTMAKQCISDDPDIMLLPELWCCGYSISKNKLLGERAERFMTWFAEEFSVAVAGSIPVLEQGNFYNRMLFVDEQGKIRGYYDKIHLFRPFGEDSVFSPGNKVSIVEYKGVKIGFEICHDLKFPELSRRLALMGVSLILVSAAWSLKRLEQWHLFTRVRAAENQVFLAASNRVGESSTLEEVFAGHSIVVDPYGSILSMLGFKQGYLIIEIDLREVEKARKQMFLLAERRKDIYEQ